MADLEHGASRRLLARNLPSREKLETIVGTLKHNAKGEVDPEDIRKLFSKLLGLRMEECPAEHEEVVSFCGMSERDKVDNNSGQTKKLPHHYP